MSEYTYIAPCHFGLEAVLKRELTDLGYTIASVEDGRVSFLGDETALCRANLFLRTAERVLLKVGSFHAETFDELFERTKALPWEQFLAADARFWVKKVLSVKSRLFSPSDIQSIIKKAIVERMKQAYHLEWFPETGTEFPLRVQLLKDEVTLAFDTSGDSLHKRGYRKLAGKAPISETLAAALILLTPWKQDRILVDPFCGSGTIPIEAALIGRKIAPGLNRSFLAEGWSTLFPKRFWYAAAEEANDLAQYDAPLEIQGYDIDAEVLETARENARLAGIEHGIHFQQRAFSQFSHPKKYGFIITNPPYGERLEEKSALPALYRQIGTVLRPYDTWSYYLITSYEDAARDLGRRPDKNRKLYNGMIKTYFYQFSGIAPPKPKRDAAQPSPIKDA